MFYAHLEGRKNFVPRSIDCGLQGACYNIVYPPDLEEVDRGDFGILINPQTFRLVYPPATRAPKIAQLLAVYDHVAGASDLAIVDVDGTAVELSELGRRICDDFLLAQDELHATDIIAPYYLASSVRDPLLKISLLSALYLADITSKNVFCGVMIDSEILNVPADFDDFANQLTSPSSPSNFYFDFNLNSSPKRPLRNPNTLSILKLLFDSLADAEKFSMLSRCNIEGLLLRGTSGLNAFSSSYYQSERYSVHGRLNQDYSQPDAVRSPTPFVFSQHLMTDVPRPLVQRLLSEGYQDLFLCGMPNCECKELTQDVSLPAVGRRAPVHYTTSLTHLDGSLDVVTDRGERASLLLRWVESAEERVKEIGRAAVSAGTFTHLGQWRSWMQDQF